MKKLLFSRSHKKHYTSTVVRMGKNNLGFSLVELIIVIAIMAILVAVAIPVLGVFIERAKIANDKQAVADVMYAIDLGGQSMQYEIAQDQIGNSTALKVPIGIIILGDKEGITVIGSTDQNKASIEAMLEDALGSNYSTDMALKYDEWEGATYASFFSSADEMMDKVDTIGTQTLNYLHNLQDNTIVGTGTDYADGKVSIMALGKTVTTVSIISKDYDNAEELTYYFAKAIKNVDRTAFVNYWVNNDTGKDEGFGLSGRENYSAARAAYNQCFANYVQGKSDSNHTCMNDSGNNKGHISQILNYGESGTEMLKSKAGSLAGTIASYLTGAGNVTFPWAVGRDAFDVSNLSENSSEGFQKCSICYELWTEYKGSVQAKADAEAFYDTMVVGASYESGDADAPYTGIIDWAKSETDTFTSLYDAVTEQKAANDVSIMITVYQDADGLLYCECNTPGVLDE